MVAAGDADADTLVTERKREPGTTTHAETVLLDDERGRARRFFVAGLGLCAGAFLLVPAIGGDPAVLPWLMAAMAAVAPLLVSTVWLQRRFPDVTAYHRLTAYLCLVVILPPLGSYFGFYSPVALLPALPIYVAAVSTNARLLSVAVLLTASGVQGGGMLLVALGVVEDRGIVQGGHLSGFQQAANIGFVVGMYALVYLFGVVNRRSLNAAVEKMEGAIREVVAGKALLDEARLDIRAAAAGRGRFEGATVGGWRLAALLGRGGMGEVYRADDTEGRRAAVKILLPESQLRPDRVKRFAREAKALAALHSPHIVEVLDVGSGHDGEPPFIAMELLEGQDLAELLRAERRLSVDEVLALVDDVAAALEVVHEAGMVHRDLKPQNLFRTREGVWKVLDFGIARLADSDAVTNLTGDGFLGTPGYLAPEQVRGEEVGPEADVFSLAAVAYRALCGRPPFSGGDLSSVVYDVLSRQPQRPSDLAAVPTAVDDVLGLALAKDRSRRLASAQELADALHDAADRGSLDAALLARARALPDLLRWGAEVSSPGLPTATSS